MSVFFVIIAIAVLAAAGLVVDGGRKVSALAEARDIADNAARACAQGLDPGSARSGADGLDPSAAAAAGQDFLAATNHTGTVTVDGPGGQTCTVRVQIEVPTVLLPGPYLVESTQTAVGLSGP